MLTKAVLAAGHGWARFSKFWLASPTGNGGTMSGTVSGKLFPSAATVDSDLNAHARSTADRLLAAGLILSRDYVATVSVVLSALKEEHNLIADAINGVEAEFASRARRAYAEEDYFSGGRYSAKALLLSAVAKWVRSREPGAV